MSNKIKKPTKAETEMLETWLSTAVELSDPKTKNGKALKQAQTALKKKEMEKVLTEIIKAFESLPTEERAILGKLTSNQLKTVEQMIGRFYRQPQTNQKKMQSEIDRYLNKSYQASQTGGSRASYVYLLAALDRAKVPLEKTPRSFQNQLRSLTTSMNKSISQPINQTGGSDTSKPANLVGGALPAIPTIPLNTAAWIIGGGLGVIFILTAIILLLRYRRRQRALARRRQVAHGEYQTTRPDSPQYVQFRREVPLDLPPADPSDLPEPPFDVYRTLPVAAAPSHYVEQTPFDVAQLYTPLSTPMTTPATTPGSSPRGSPRETPYAAMPATPAGLTPGYMEMETRAEQAERTGYVTGRRRATDPITTGYAGMPPGPF